ncbi:MAG TPA: fibronectin type III domain-containing protein [Gemmatimonadales bacterium]|nr:fibronectin type III domain-containing protein [Gemmatimonadales bacterium]
MLIAAVAAVLAGCKEAGNPMAPETPEPAAAVQGASLRAPTSAAAVAASATQIAISWQDNSSNETGFQVDRSTNGAFGNFTRLVTTGANAKTWLDGELAPASSYCYRVRAVRQKGGVTQSSLYSNTACAVTLALPPPPPPPPPASASAVTAVPSGSSQVTLSWIDNSSTEDGFRLYRSFDGGLVWTFYGTAGANTTSVGVGAIAEQQVCARVVAYNAGGESAPSNAACAVPPAGPTNLTATMLDSETLSLAWSDNSGVEDGYRVLVFQTNCIGACNAFDPLCEEYGICTQEIVIVDLAANSRAWTGRFIRNNSYVYELVYVVATKAGGISDQSGWVMLP